MMGAIVAAILYSLLLLVPLDALADQGSQQKPVAAASTMQAQLATVDTASATDLKLQQQQLAFFKERLDLQDKRIGDISLYLAVFGALMTVMVVFFSLRANREAVSAAKEEARKETEEWLDNDGQKLLLDKIDAFLKPEVDKALREIREATDGKLGELEAERQTAHDHNLRHKEIIDELIARGLDKSKPLSADQKQQLDETTKDLESTPSTQYLFNDWFMLGVKAYEAAKYETAADHFTKAVELADKPQLRALALVNKGAMFDYLGRSEEAIAAYDEVVKCYGDAPEAALRERVAMALFNKGAMLGKANESAQKIAAFDEVVKRYEDAPEAEVQKIVASALNGLGFDLLCEAKRNRKEENEEVAAALLGQALARIEQALERVPDDPIKLGNRGYILFLQGKTEEARAVLAEALRLGGKELRQGELDDAEIHPLPQDEEFKALINSL